MLVLTLAGPGVAHGGKKAKAAPAKAVEPSGPCTIDLRGATDARPPNTERVLTRAGLKVDTYARTQGHHEKTQVFHAPACQEQALAVAQVLGLTAAEVKPLSWQSPFGLTVALGAREHELLLKTARARDWARVKVLLEQGADPNAWHGAEAPPLLDAASSGDLEMVRLLLDRGADPNGNDHMRQNALELAALGKHVAICELLLDRGADLKLTGMHGLPIHAAAEGGSAEVVKLMLARGAKVGDLTGGKSTPLHRAGSAEVAKLLLERGAKLNARDNSGNAPLHVISDPGAIGVLLDKGADINLRDSNGWTPLHHAARDEKGLEWATFLVERGANIHAASTKPTTEFRVYDPYRFGKGSTPLDVAQGLERFETAAFLESKGAEPRVEAVAEPQE